MTKRPRRWDTAAARLDVLGALTHDATLRSTRVAEITGRPLRTVQRALAVLRDEGLVLEDRTTTYAIAPSGLERLAATADQS